MLDERFRNLRQLLIRHEALRLKAYKCKAGKVTIGVGRNLDDVGITEQEAMILLTGDILRVTREAATFPWFKSLSTVRQDVVLNMIFNLGLDGFRGFPRTIAALSNQNYQLAATEMLNSRWAAQVGRRAVELAQMMRTGNYV